MNRVCHRRGGAYYALEGRYTGSTDNTFNHGHMQQLSDGMLKQYSGRLPRSQVAGENQREN